MVVAGTRPTLTVALGSAKGLSRSTSGTPVNFTTEPFWNRHSSEHNGTRSCTRPPVPARTIGSSRTRSRFGRPRPSPGPAPTL